MWFQYPKGTTAISVNLHEYGVDFRDPDGVEYFRAPEHFAPTILGLPGFRQVGAPKGAPPDLPPEPAPRPEARDEIHETLRSQVAELQIAMENLKGVLTVTSAERDDLKLKLHEAQTRIDELEDRAVSQPQARPPVVNPPPASAAAPRK